MSRLAHNRNDVTAKFSLRDVDLNDMDDLFAWRNHPAIRVNSFNQIPIAFSEHKKWFSAKLKDKDTAMYIAHLGAKKIGAIRFDSMNGVVKVNVMLNPDYMNRGFGSKIIKMGTERFMKEKRNVSRIIAEIKKENAASIKSFRKAGFKESHVSYVFEAGAGYERKKR